MKIRKAKKSDFDGILRIFIESSVQNPEDKGNKQLKEYLLFSIKNRNMLVLVASFDKEIVGVGICQLKEIRKEDAKLLDIYVLKKYRGKRIGERLMKELYKLLKKKGIKNLGLYSENNKKTLNFYKKQGFQIGRLIRRCDKRLK